MGALKDCLHSSTTPFPWSWLRLHHSPNSSQSWDSSMLSSALELPMGKAKIFSLLLWVQRLHLSNPPSSPFSLLREHICTADCRLFLLTPAFFPLFFLNTVFLSSSAHLSMTWWVPQGEAKVLHHWVSFPDPVHSLPLHGADASSPPQYLYVLTYTSPSVSRERQPTIGRLRRVTN